MTISSFEAPIVASPAAVGATQIAADQDLTTAMERISFEEYRYARWGLVSGLACVMLGTALTLAGAGAATAAGWHVTALGLDSSLTAATPGIVAMVVGTLVTFISRPSVTLKDVRQHEDSAAASATTRSGPQGDTTRGASPDAAEQPPTPASTRSASKGPLSRPPLFLR